MALGSRGNASVSGVRGSWIASVTLSRSVWPLLRMLRKPVIPTDLSSISRADRTISKANQSSQASRSDQAEVQAATKLAWSTAALLLCWIQMSGLMILISTLPVKGEESLDLQSPLTASEP